MRRIKFFALIIFGVMLHVLLPGCEFSVPPPPSPAVKPIKYEVTKLPSGFELLWATSSVDIFPPQNKGSISLVIGDKNAYSLGTINDSGPLVVVNLLNGEPSLARIDESYSAPRFGGVRAATLAINSDFLFVGFDGTQKISGNTEIGAGNLKSFDLNEVSEMWTQTIAGSRSLDTVVGTENTISVDGSFSSSYFTFNAQNGELLERREKDELRFVWTIDGQILYERSPEASFIATDIQSGNMIWKSSFSHGIYQPPVFTDSVIVARVGKSTDLGSVMGIDITNGKLLWEHANSISNVSANNSKAFFITDEVELNVVDIETGNLIEKIPFTPSTRVNTIKNAFHVAANENMVLVYLGEGQQLMAFHIPPK